jgi:hypothetical protein
MAKLPPWPDNVGKPRVFTSIDGRRMHFVVEDEIARLQETAHPGKLIYIQQIRFKQEQRFQYRFTYYRIGVKAGARGRWVFGQSSVFVPREDLEWLLKQARRRKWPGF